MNEERRMILEMLKEGAITVEEAERLMEALPVEGAREPVRENTAISLPSGRIGPKRILVCVTENGKKKVNIKVPFSLVRVGLKLGKTFGAVGAKFVKNEEDAQALAILNELDIDEIIASLDDGEITLPYTIVDVDDDENGDHVQVVLE